MNIHFHGIWRMDWGFGNPNQTAALIALLMIAIWALPLVKRWLFWVALPIFAGLGVCLMHTMSRGGFVAAMAGLGILLWRLPRPWPRNRMAAIVISVTLMLVGAVAFQATTRVAQSWQDRSITNRLDIWRCAPQMILDAPHGWGAGNAAHAFASWYQPLDRKERYLNLVNGHLTWLVEFGWPMRLLYIAGWVAVFVMSFPSRNRPGFAIAWGLWWAFFVANTFSMVCDIRCLWILPVLGLIVVLVTRIRGRLWPSCASWALGLMIGIVALAALCIPGVKRSERKLYAFANSSVCVGGCNPKLWVLVDPAANGNYPHVIRDYYNKTPNAPAIGLATSLAAVPKIEGSTLIVFGAHSKDEWHSLAGHFANGQKLVFVSPNVSPSELNLPRAVLSESPVLFGEFTRQFNVSAWANAGKVQRLEGVGDFFQNWPEIVFAAMK